MLGRVHGDANDSVEKLAALSARHVRVGWAMILAYVLLGLLLETLHGFKAGLYLDVSNEARRLVWTLAHSHGTLIGVLNLAFALTLAKLELSPSELQRASLLFVASGVVMPLGFFLGGVVIYGGDPGLPILLAPIGGLMLVGAIGLAALGALRGRREAAPDDTSALPQSSQSTHSNDSEAE